MKKFKFTLSTMLHYKDALLDKEKNTLLQLRAEQVLIERKIAESDVQMLNLEQQMKEKAMQGTTAMELRTYEFHCENARSLKKQLEDELDELAHIIEKQRKLVVALSQEVSGLEKLEQKQQEEYDYAVQKEEDLRIGELISSKIATERTS